MSDYQLFRPLEDERFQALKDDIAKRGVLVPVEVDEDGRVLDGHHRLRAVRELQAEGVDVEDPATITRTGWSDQDKRDHVRKINLLRRQLGPVEWAQQFRAMAEERGVRLGSGKGDPTGKADTVSALAGEVGVHPRTARRRMQLADELSDHEDLAEKVDREEMTAKRARRVAREREAEQRADAELADPTPIHHDADVRLCDFRDLDLEARSADLILTDPPYPSEYLDCWMDLAEAASSWLRDGGLLVAMAGQWLLPEYINALAAWLDYEWCGAVVLPGAHNQVHPIKVRNRVKPLLFYSNGGYQPSGWIEDLHTSEGRDKDAHDWQQSVGTFAYYVRELTSPGDLVVDPFLGAGTTAQAAVDTGRRFVGCDVDKKAVAATRERLAS